MRILLLNWRDVRHPKAGGAELVTMEHAKRWVGKGHTVTWLTAGYPGAKKESVVNGVHFVRRWGSLTIYLYAPIYLLTNAHFFDVIVDEVHGFPFFSPLFTRKPVVVFIHEIAGEIWDFMFSFPKNSIGKTLEKWYFKLYRKNIFWTDAPSTVDELVARGIARKQCIAIPCPIVTSDELRVTSYVKEKNPTYLFVSRVVRMKGVEEIIKAFSFITRSQKNARLWIVGSGEDRYIRELTDMMKEYDVERSVTFFGQVTEKKKFDLMSRAHLLLHASVKEGWGPVVLEVAWVGTPAVVYRVPGLSDVVKDQHTGIVLGENSPIVMAKEALALVSDSNRYGRYQKNGKAWIASLKWKDVTQKSLALLEKATMV